MRRALPVLVALASLALSPGMAAAETWQPAGPADALAPLAPIPPGPIEFPARSAPRLVVGVAPGADLDAVAAALQPYASRLTILRPVGEIAVRASNAAAIADLAAHDPRIAFAEPERSFAGLAEPADAIDPQTGFAFDWQYDAVHAGPALAAVGGGSSAAVAVVDTGVDAAQPDLAGRLLPGFDATGGGSVFDNVGHGTFVAGLISMIDGDGIGGRGIAGATAVLPVRASADGEFTSSATVLGITWAADNGASVINLSLGGTFDDPAIDRAIDYATAKGVLVVAAAGNGGDLSDPVLYPAAYVGGVSGGWGIGLSVAASTPYGHIASFSTHNRYVSIAAPGAGATGCSFGDFSTLPVSTTSTDWDDSNPCNNVVSDPANPAAGRFAYGEGTSFAAPIVAAVASLVRQANPALSPGQVADVLRRSATQTIGTGWNEWSGDGIVDAEAAVALARAYDTTPPAIAFSTVARNGGIQTDIVGTDDAGAGQSLSGAVTVGVEESRDGSTYVPMVLPAPTAVHELISTSGAIWLRATVCDANHNCVLQQAGPLTPLPGPVAQPAAKAKTRASVRLRIVSHRRRTLRVRLDLGKGAKGSAVVQVEEWNGKRWRGFDRVSVRFGASKVVSEVLAGDGRYRFRAHLLSGPNLVSALSRAVELRVR
jgi:subtilisin family serine protease